jgi:uncharacterized membrane protein YfcA
MVDLQLLSPLMFAVSLFGVSVVAGLVGALLGLGGGIVVVPVLTLVYGIDIRYAAGASIVTVIATSSGAAAAYVRERMTNLRVAMFLELGTTTGAITGAYLAGVIRGRWLFVAFGLVMGFSALAMLRRKKEHLAAEEADPWAGRLKLHGCYFDQATGRQVDYHVTHVGLGLVLMYVAGILSGLLGIGSGALKVPAMDLAMRLPIKVSSATSNFMIGVTAAASAGVFFSRGYIDPFIAAPVAAGVVLGATFGSRLLGRLDSWAVRVAFVIVLVVVSLQMIWKGLA